MKLNVEKLTETSKNKNSILDLNTKGQGSIFIPASHIELNHEMLVKISENTSLFLGILTGGEDRGIVGA